MLFADQRIAEKQARDQRNPDQEHVERSNRRRVRILAQKRFQAAVATIPGTNSAMPGTMTNSAADGTRA